MLNTLTLATGPNNTLPNVTFALVLTHAYNVEVDQTRAVLYVTVVPLPANTIKPLRPNPPSPDCLPFRMPYQPSTTPINVTLVPGVGTTGRAL